MAQRTHWNDKDKQILKEFWDKVMMDDLRKLFQGRRSVGAIRQQASVLGLSHTGRESYIDEDFAKSLRKRIKI